MHVIWPKPGKYIVAVSGGVDSVCLLGMLVAHGGYELIVAHVDHGIREDSTQDLELVQKIAHNNKLHIVYTKYNYTIDTSEQELRQARYDFLFEQKEKFNAAAILTAHHADDVLETSIMNIRRGTDRYGAAGGMTRKGIVRPLINMRKKELVDYAKNHNLIWREDSTNNDLKYTRNKIRHQVIPGIDTSEYQKHLYRLGELNIAIDSELKDLVLVLNEGITIPRTHLNRLGLREVEVLLAYALRQASPNIELSQPRIAEAARQIMLGAHKISFSTGPQECIIIEIP